MHGQKVERIAGKYALRGGAAQQQHAAITKPRPEFTAKVENA